MTSKANFIHGGGWITRQTTSRPKTKFFASLAVLGLGLSLCIAIAAEGLGVFSSPRSWVVLLVLESAFVAPAVFFSLTEEPITRVEEIPDPEYDEHNLY